MSFFKRRRHPHPNQLEANDHDTNVDQDLRLRTVRTAASTIAESIASEQRAERRRSVRHKRSNFFRSKSTKDLERERPSAPVPDPSAVQVAGDRRNVYVNTPLTAIEVDRHGEPIVRYARNKVKTTKYTIITFVPKNLYEQFRRVANLYFLVLFVLQVFSIFGAVSPQTAALPLMFILTVTAIKDAVEDYRRATLDEEVNTSAATKFGNWRNVNQPKDPRNWFERLLRLNSPGRVTKGVRKLREREASEGSRVVLSRAGNRISGSVADPSSLSLDRDGSRNRLEDIQSIDSHSYPPLIGNDPLQPVFSPPAQNPAENALSATLAASSSSGVVNWSRRISGSARWERTLWKKLEVGDIVLLRDNEQVPADIVVLSTSDPDGLCYLETKNLDGETNLKPRKATDATSNILTEEDIERSAFVLDSEPPHPNLYLYNGVLRFQDQSSGQLRGEPVTINEMLLRGCSIRNTAWVIGLVVFTGKDTKIMLNGGETPSKQSKIEKETNFNVIVNFIILFLMCTVTAIVNGIFDARTGTSAAVFEVGSDPSSSNVVNALVTFASCLIAFQNIVPISLYISIEIVKTIQAYFISQDIDMYYKPLDSACIPKTWNISDDLGQIEYIFSDKTGTLTQNVMEFQKCSIHGVTYGEAITEAQRGAAQREGRTDLPSPDEQSIRMTKLRQDMQQLLGRAFKNRYVQPDKLTLVSTKLAEDLTDRGGGQRTHIISFFRALAVCHTVLADRPGPETGQHPHLLEYKAESPDESALVGAARDVGFPFVSKSREKIDIEVMGQPESYILLKVLEFNSTRKRMSVIVRNPQGQIILYCKGADSVIYERLAEDHDLGLKDKTSKDMEAFANSGLRTLCIAYRLMSDEEYLEWSRVYDAAASSIKDRDEEIDQANSLVEHSLHVLGATALEDKLQEGVPEAIEKLHSAGIKLWILTGDKVQTAIEIAFSCNLLKNDMEIMILSADTIDGARVQIEAGLNKIASVLGPPSRDPSKRHFSSDVKASFAVVIDGDTLRYALDPALKPLFLNLGTQCETVVCCRVSPAQKALTVKLVKEGRDAMTLSIGDGANDVAMIQEANIGVGLFGLEGSQAAMSADYAFGQFRFLTKLLIVHGRWSYRRIADMHSNFFYKNVIWTLPLFWFLIYNSFDGTYLYHYTFILLYNLIFTSLPVIALGAFDQDINAKAALAFPQLYIRGIRGLEYTRTKFWLYMLDGLYQSAIVFYIPYLVWTAGSAISWNGKTVESLSDFGTTVAVAAIVTANTYVGINTQYWTVITWVIVLGSSIVMLLWVVIYSYFESFDFVHEARRLFGGVTFWVTVILTVSIALLPRVLVKFVSISFVPQDADIIRYMWVKGDLKDRLGIRHRQDQPALMEGQSSILEATPIFREPHSRSLSEMSATDGYESALTFSPGVPTPPTQPEKPDAASPQISAALADSSIPLPLITIAGTTNDEDMMPTPTSLTSAAHVAATSPSPQFSYYSASDIPIPSPLPSLGFQQPSQDYSRMAPISYSRPLRGQYPAYSHSDNLLTSPSSYEMRVHSPQSNQDSYAADRRELPRISEASHTITHNDNDDNGGSHHSPSPGSEWLEGTQWSAYEGPTAL